MNAESKPSNCKVEGEVLELWMFGKDAGCVRRLDAQSRLSRLLSGEEVVCAQ